MDEEQAVEGMPENEADLPLPFRAPVDDGAMPVAPVQMLIEAEWACVMLKKLYTELMGLQNVMLGAAISAAGLTEEQATNRVQGLQERDGDFYLIVLPE
jgi:hypothetical protein